jgi:hypothetical protein
MNEPYGVSLHGMDGLPAAEKISAELRFIKELNRGLGGADAVVEAYRAWRDACECDASELSAAMASLAVKWPKAFETAQRAGLKNIGESDAHFELHLTPQSAAAY